VDWSKWLQLIQEYGPLVGLFVGFIIWQTFQINRLLERNSAIYDAEIKRLAEVQSWLLSHVLGPQPSSFAAPSVRQLKDDAKQLENKGTPKKGGS